MRTEDSTLLSTVLLVFFSTLMGCGETSSNMSVSEIPVQGTERLEHHQAAHHPDTYAAAVSQIELSHARIQAQIKHSESDSLKGEIQEMLDILEWLPIIAADSDLKKPDWETANQCATQLKKSYDAYAKAVNSGHRLQEIPSDGCRRAMELLRALVPVADRRP